MVGPRVDDRRRVSRSRAPGKPVKLEQRVPYDINGRPTGATLADGDYGDVVVSDAGATMEFDPDVVTAYARTLLAAADAAAARAVLAAQEAHAILSALAGLDASVGLLEQTGASTFVKRALGVGAASSVPTRADADGRYVLASVVGAAGGVASLDGSGLVPSSQLPALALTDVHVVASQAAQLALTAQEGDVAVRTDLNRSFVHNGGSAGTMADWQELLTPTDTVLSVNGETGAVSLVASEIPNVPAGGIAGITVQAALNELDTEKQAAHGNLTALSGLTLIADRLLYANGAGTMALATFTSVARTLLAQTSQSDMRTTGLGLGTIATQASNNVAITGGSVVVSNLRLEATTAAFTLKDTDGATTAAIQYLQGWDSGNLMQWRVGMPFAGGDLYLLSNNTVIRLATDGGTSRVVVTTTGLQLTAHPTTASAANAFIDTADSNYLKRSTSSARYKRDIRDVDPALAVERLRALRPVRYRSKAGGDDPSLEHYGLIAEEVAQIDPMLVQFGFQDDQFEDVEEGPGFPGRRGPDGEWEIPPSPPGRVRRVKAGEGSRPDAVQYDRLAVLLLAFCKSLDARLARLEALPVIAGPENLPQLPGNGKR